MTALVAGLLPILMIGTLLLLLNGLQGLSLWPLREIGQQGDRQVIQVLTTLGSGDPRQGVVTMGAVSSLVGMLFDTYAFCSSRSVAHRS